MSVYTTEITSDKIPSDNPIHQRLLSAYYHAKTYIKGDLLELGCGEGRGVELLAPRATSYTGIDKIKPIIEQLRIKHPGYKFIKGVFPPFPFQNNQFDTIIAFQVIEHIKKDEDFVEEICRVLKPEGRALITTPNVKMTLSRNPWHIREYTADQLASICEKYFSNVEVKGIAGSERIMEYHERNRKSVNRIMRYDIFNLQHRLPASFLKKPYEVLNRLNRKKLKSANDELVSCINQEDFILKGKDEQNLDLFCLLNK
ncbi:MAG: class I SAM-dependent methyltransferase [Bacteroidota bacterium]